jgi:hypothetical protein
MALSGLDKAILEAHARYEGNLKLIGKHAREKMGMAAEDMSTKAITDRLAALLKGSNIEVAAFLEQERVRDELRRLRNKEKLDAKAYNIQEGLLELNARMVRSACVRVEEAETTASWSKAVDSSVKLSKSLKEARLPFSMEDIKRDAQEDAQLAAEEAALREGREKEQKPQPVITQVIQKGDGFGQA